MIFSELCARIGDPTARAVLEDWMLERGNQPTPEANNEK